MAHKKGCRKTQSQEVTVWLGRGISNTEVKAEAALEFSRGRKICRLVNCSRGRKICHHVRCRARKVCRHVEKIQASLKFRARKYLDMLA